MTGNYGSGPRPSVINSPADLRAEAHAPKHSPDTEDNQTASGSKPVVKLFPLLSRFRSEIFIRHIEAAQFLLKIMGAAEHCVDFTCLLSCFQFCMCVYMIFSITCQLSTLNHNFLTVIHQDRFSCNLSLFTVMILI